MDFVLIKMDSDRWNEVWQYVETHPINEGLEEPSVALNEGYMWEYMGTYRQGDKGITEFLHRLHPATKGLYKLTYSHEIKNEEIEKKFKI